MTQTSSIDLGAAATLRATRPQAPYKQQGDFGVTYKQAEHQVREQQKPREFDRADAAREQQAQAADATEANRQVDAKEATCQADEAMADRNAEAVLDNSQVTATEKPAQEQPKAEAASEAPEQAPEHAPAVDTDTQAVQADPQAALALMIAAGGQVAMPVAPAVTADVAMEIPVATGAVEAPTTLQSGNLADALEALQLQQAAAAKAQPAAQAAPQTAAEAQTDTAQVPAVLAQATQGLGPVKILADNAEPQAVTPPVATEGEAGEASNLSIQLLTDQPVEEVPKGLIALAMPLDDAAGIETPTTGASLITEEGESSDNALAADATTVQGITPSLNGETKVSDAPRAAEAKSSEAARAQEAMPQVIKGMDQLKLNQQNAIKLQLYPEHLGKMEIKISSHQGVISAQFTADTQSTKAMLESQMAMLQRNFADMGIKVDKVEVMLASANLNFDSQGQNGGAMFFDQGQGSERQQQAPVRANAGNGYAQWLDEPALDEQGLSLGEYATAINYVA